jgi:hypothetical protein
MPDTNINQTPTTINQHDNDSEGVENPPGPTEPNQPEVAPVEIPARPETPEHIPVKD